MMKEAGDNISNYGGIYVILNVLECKVYVGQSMKLNDRDHISELQNRIDNNIKLQNDYNDLKKEFVYFIVVSYQETIEKMRLNAYEQLYIKIFEDLGFFVYNSVKKKELPEMIKCEYDRGMRELTADFVNHFGIEPEKMLQSTYSDRKGYLEYYVQMRWNPRDEEQKKIICSDRFFFNKKRLEKIFSDSRISKKHHISIYDIDFENIFFSKAGNYIGEGLDQILHYEIATTNEVGYCLWTFGGNAIARACVSKIVEKCRNRSRNGKDTYVLFKYTSSSEYASGDACKFDMFPKKNAKHLTLEEKCFLNFDNGKYGRTYVPQIVNCTAAYSENTKSAKAFVISEFLLLDEWIKDEDLSKFQAIKEDGFADPNKNGLQRNTHFLVSQKDKRKDILESFNGPEGRSFCFIGKLAAPYLIELERE